MTDYSVTRVEILNAAKLLLGLPFVHQGRSTETGVDCVGLLVAIGRVIDYPEIHDVEGYRRIPSSSTIREVLGKKCDKIPLSEMKVGDFFLMRLNGRIPRHAAVFFNNESDPARGVVPTILHAAKTGVTIQPISDFPSSWYVAGFRVRGVKD